MLLDRGLSGDGLEGHRRCVFFVNKKKRTIQPNLRKISGFISLEGNIAWGIDSNKLIFKIYFETVSKLKFEVEKTK